jgi:hypothetical protein
MDAGLRACSACSFSSVVQVWLGKVGILRAWRVEWAVGEWHGEWACPRGQKDSMLVCTIATTDDCGWYRPGGCRVSGG